MMRGIRGVLCVGVVLCAGSAWAQPLGNLEQKCVNTINKDVSQVQAAKGKVDAGCVKNQVKKVPPPSAEACITDDAHSKISGATAKTTADDGLRCLSNIPAFAYVGAGTANAAAVGAEENLLHDEYGNPADSGLLSCDTHPAECKCQTAVGLRLENVIRTLDAEFVRCKNAALAIGKTTAFPLGAASASDVARCITDVTIGQSVAADPKGAAGKAESKLTASRTKFCTVGGEFNGGACTGLSGSILDNCLVNHAKCRFCQMANLADGLAANCGTFSGIACP